MTTFAVPTFSRIRSEAYPAQETANGVAATYNIAELAAWNTAVTGWVAPTTSYDPAEQTYLETCLTAARTARYTPGTQLGGSGQHSTATGVGTTIIARLLQLGIQASDPPVALLPICSLAVTFPDFTVAGTANVVAATVPGTLAVTFPDFTVVGTGAASVAGVLASTFPDFTVVGTGFIPSVVASTLAVTFPDFALASTVVVPVTGSLAVTMPDFTLVGTGFVPSVVASTLAVTMPDFTLASTVVVPVTCSLAVTMPDFTLVGTADVAGAVNLVLDFSNPAHIATAALL